MNTNTLKKPDNNIGASCFQLNMSLEGLDQRFT